MVSEKFGGTYENIIIVREEALSKVPEAYTVCRTIVNDYLEKRTSNTSPFKTNFELRVEEVVIWIRTINFLYCKRSFVRCVKGFLVVQTRRVFW